MLTKFKNLRVIKTGLEEEMEVEFNRYGCNKNLSVQLFRKGRPWAMVSSNIAEILLEPDEFFVGEHNLSPKIMKVLRECGEFTDTGESIPSGFVRLPIWKVNNFGGTV